MPKSSKHRKMEDDYLGFLKSELMDKQADYVRRGRPQQHLSDEDLLENWVHTFQAWANYGRFDESSRGLKQLEQELAAELSLRSIELPHGRVRGAMKKLMAIADENIARLARNPEEQRLRNEQLQAEVDEFVQARDRPKN